MIKNFKIEGELKKRLKRKINISKGLIIAFLITGGFLSNISYSEDYEKDPTENQQGVDGTDGFTRGNSAKIEYDPKGVPKILDNKVPGNTLDTTKKRGTGVALGAFSHAGQGGVALGSHSSSKGAVFVVGIGFQARATKASAIAIGAGSYAEGYYSQAYGRSATALGNESIAQGVTSLAKEKGSIAIGTNATSSGENAIAIGSSARERNALYQTDPKKRVDASGKNSVALGHIAQASGENALSFGYKAESTMMGAIALGSESKTTVDKGVMGYVPSADKTLSGNAWQSTHAALAIGNGSTVTRQITGLAAGKEDTDAVNVAQLKALATKLEDDKKTYFHVNTGTHNGGDKSSNLGKIGEAAGAEGKYSITAGMNANAKEEASIAIGYNSKSLKKHTIAVGMHANSEGEASISIGYGAKTSNDYSISLGRYAESKGTDSLSIGSESVAEKNSAIAIGRKAKSKEDSSISIGKSAQSFKSNSITFGTSAMTNGESSIAVGTNSKSEGAHAIAIGKESRSEKLDALSIGHQAVTTAERTIALGSYSKATKDYGIAIGLWSEAAAMNAIAIGGNAMSKASGSIAIGVSSKVEEDAINGIAIGKSSKSSKEHSIAIGTNTEAKDDGAIALGDNAKAVKNAISIGKESKSSDENSIAFGYNSEAKGKHSISIGAYAVSENTNDISLGLYAKAKGGKSIAIGQSSEALKSDSIAIGRHSKVTVDESVAIGSESETKTPAASLNVTIENLKYGNFAAPNVSHVVAIGSKNKERQLQYVGAGQVSKDSTDAINGSQLFATNNILGKFANKTKSIFGGNANLAENGELTFTNIGGTNKDTIHEAIKSLDDKITKSIAEYGFNVMAGKEGTGTSSGENKTKLLKDELLTLKAGDNLSITQAGKDFTYALSKTLKDLTSAEFNGTSGGKVKITGDEISINNGSDKVKITKDGLDNGGKVLKNIGDGKNDTDAVNKKQLDEVEKKIDTSKKELENKIDESKKEIEKNKKEIENKIDETKKELEKKIEDNKKEVDKKIDETKKELEEKITKNDEKIESTKKDLTDKIDKATKTLKTDITANSGEEANKTKGPVTLTSKKSNEGHNIYDISLSTTQLKSSSGGKVEKLSDEDSKKVANAGEVSKAINALGNNSISFGGDSGETDKQSLNKDGGLNFKISGSGYIKTEAKGNEVKVDLTDKAKKDIEKGIAANSGVANAIAMANLSQMSGIGHNLSGSYGYYNGEHAFAIGLSGMNDRANLVYRASGSLNTRGHISLGAGLGYQFESVGNRNKEMLKLQRNGNINLLDEKVYELDKEFKVLEEKVKVLEENNKTLENRINELEILMQKNK